MEIKQETLDLPPEPPTKKYKWCFQSSRQSGQLYSIVSRSETRRRVWNSVCQFYAI